MGAPRLHEFTVGRRRTASALAKQLIDRILSSKLRPGDFIGFEVDMAASMGCSRPVLRETLRILEHEGAVVVKPGAHGGVFCSEPDVLTMASSLQLYGAFHEIGPVALGEARTELEASMTRLAAEHATDDELAQIASIGQEWRDACAGGDFARAAAANQELHEAIANAARSPALKVLSEVTEAILFRDAYWPVRRDLSVIGDLHDGIIDALRARDGERASFAMRSHLIRFRQRALEMEREGWITEAPRASLEAEPKGGSGSTEPDPILKRTGSQYAR
ncbi:MAG: FCD domain-containing protein [Actinobacteria bacterium]|nr:FCD domain-containing protein [Actinomycetota bacterium]